MRTKKAIEIRELFSLIKFVMLKYTEYEKRYEKFMKEMIHKEKGSFNGSKSGNFKRCEKLNGNGTRRTLVYTKQALIYNVAPLVVPKPINVNKIHNGILFAVKNIVIVMANVSCIESIPICHS